MVGDLSGMEEDWRGLGLVFVEGVSVWGSFGGKVVIGVI